MSKLSLRLLLVPSLCVLYASGARGGPADSAAAITLSECSAQTLAAFSADNEILHRRTLTAKHFGNHDGTYTAVISCAPVHYLDQNSTWCDIDTRILESRTYPCGQFYNETNNFQSYFPAGADGASGARLTYQEADLIHWREVRLSWTDPSGSEYPLCEISAASARADGNRVLSEDSFAQLEVQFTVTNVGIRREIVLKKAPACLAEAADGSWLNVVERLMLPVGYCLSVGGQRQMGDFSADGPVEIRTAGDGGFVTMDPLRIIDRWADESSVTRRARRWFRFVDHSLYCYNQIPIECFRLKSPTGDEGDDGRGPGDVRASTLLRPTVAAWWTGFMDPYWFHDPYNNYGCGDADIIVGTPDLVNPFGIYRGWAKFDVSSITGDVTDSVLDIHTFQTLWDKGMHVDYYSIDYVDPQYAHLTDANVQLLYADCQDGTQYYNNKWWPTSGWVGAVDLGPVADDDIETPWNGAGWWAVGFASDTPVGGEPGEIGEALKGSGYNAGDNAPKLTVTYTAGCPSPGESGYYCNADIDGSNDCLVMLNDLAQLLAHYGTTSGATRMMGDVNPPPNGDGDVDLSDLALLLAQYGDDCN